MKNVTGALGVIMVAGALLVPSALAQTGPTASADIVGTQGQTVGTAHFTQDSAGGVRVHVVVQGLTGLEGQHGIHVHAVGTCEPDKQFSTAGPHFNPTGAQHGLRNPQGPHVGDLPNLSVDATGAGMLEYTSNLISLSPGPNNIFDEDGAAIVIHAGMDDEVSDPAGNSGARVACGVIGLLATEGAGMPRTGATEAALPWLMALIASVMTGLGAIARSRGQEGAAIRLRIERDNWR
ncbi:MAG: superoxide dismutase family protein [Chloroflexota bacterium]|nr:superoxide dismutase family protein [Chloroflexota bacterium]MDQ5866114.1 superoxide dismutase family protein [Chloroflexota bacterium]